MSQIDKLTAGQSKDRQQSLHRNETRRATRQGEEEHITTGCERRTRINFPTISDMLERLPRARTRTLKAN